MTSILLERYERLELASRQMLNSAQAQDWQEVRRLEQKCEDEISWIRENAAAMACPPQEKSIRHRILLTILRHDAMVRSLADPWMERALTGREH